MQELLNNNLTFVKKFCNALKDSNNFLIEEKMNFLLEKKEKLNNLFCKIHQIYPSISSSQIIPMILGEAKKAKEKALSLQNEGYYVLPINPPTVPVGTSRLRISLTADIDFEEICNIFG